MQGGLGYLHAVEQKEHDSSVVGPDLVNYVMRDLTCHIQLTLFGRRITRFSLPGGVRWMIFFTTSGLLHMHARCKAVL